MIRDVVKTITVSRQVEVNEIVNKEKINAVSINTDNKILSAHVALLNPENLVVQEKMVTVSGKNYDLLFSNDAFFGEGKQEGSYRESDLWKVIDKVTAQ